MNVPEAVISSRLLAANKVYFDRRSEEAHVWHALRWAQSSAESRALIAETKRISLLVKAAMDERLQVIDSEAASLLHQPLLVFPRSHH